MDQTFKRIAEVQAYLAEHGYHWIAKCKMIKGDIYEARDRLAVVRRVPFKGYNVTIGCRHGTLQHDAWSTISRATGAS